MTNQPVMVEVSEKYHIPMELAAGYKNGHYKGNPEVITNGVATEYMPVECFSFSKETFEYFDTNINIAKVRGFEEDDYMILPSFDLAETYDKDVLFTKYLQKNNGQIVNNLDYQDTQQIVNRISGDNLLKGLYTVEEAYNFDTASLYMGVEDLVITIGIFALIAMFF